MTTPILYTMRTLIFLLLISIPAASGYSQSNRTGQDHALFFAVSNYEDDGLTDLPQPISNARAIAQELEQRFGFKTEIVEDPTLAEIQNKLADYQQRYENGRLPSDGQLFIFFSGHGVKAYGNGYFLPSDSDPDQVITTGLAYNIWRPFIDDIPCKHILVAVDACFSVTFDPNWQTRGDDTGSRFRRKGELSEEDRILSNHKRFPSRLFFTSDAQEDVVPGRSNFARMLLDGLANSYPTMPYLTAEELFASYIKKAQPTPNAGDFGKDDVRSNFLFFYQTATNIDDSRADRIAWQEARNTNTATAYHRYLQQYPEGDFRPLAEQRLNTLETEERERLAWDATKNTNTRQAYQDFIAAYPNSPYRELAEHRRKESIAKDKHSTIKDPQTNSFGNQKKPLNAEKSKKNINLNRCFIKICFSNETEKIAIQAKEILENHGAEASLMHISEHAILPHKKTIYYHQERQYTNVQDLKYLLQGLSSLNIVEKVTDGHGYITIWL